MRTGRRAAARYGDSPGVAGGAACCAVAAVPAEARAVATAVMSVASTKTKARIGPPYDLISRPSGSFISALIIDGAPLFARPPVQVMTSPDLMVLRIHPYDRRWFRLIISISHATTLPLSSLTSRYTNACGFVHSNRVTVPVIVVGFAMSYIAVE